MLPDSTSFQFYRVVVATDAAFTSIARFGIVNSIMGPSWVVEPALDTKTKYYWHVQACTPITSAATGQRYAPDDK